MENEPTVFSTTDYGLVAFLLCAGIRAHAVERPGRDVTFIYHAEPALLKAIGDYSGNAPVKSRDFFNALRRARITISEKIRGESNHAEKSRS